MRPLVKRATKLRSPGHIICDPIAPHSVKRFVFGRPLRWPAASHSIRDIANLRFGTAFSDERGAVAVYIGVITAVLIGFAGLAIDLSRLGTLQTQLQNSADQSALAGAAELDGLDDSVVRATRAIYGEAGIEAQLTQNAENIAGQGTIAVSRFRLLGSIPSDGTAIDCPFWLTSFVAAQSYVPSGGGVHCPTAWNNVRFIEVVVEQRTISTSLIAALRTLGANSATQSTTTARALAGFTQYVCKAAPMFTCNPTELTANGEVIMNPGQMLLMKEAGGNDAQYGPGNYGILDPIFNNQGSANVAGNIASANSEGCFSLLGVEVNQGQSTGPVKQAINVRFDIYENPQFGSEAGNSDYRPARNVTKGCRGTGCGTTYGNFNQDPALWDLTAKGAPMPRADCNYNNSCSMSCFSGQCRMSADTNWGTTSREAYWTINHPQALMPGVTPAGNQYNRPNNWGSMTRFETYRWEIDSNHIPDRTRDDGALQPCGADPANYPTSYNASCAEGEQGRPKNYTNTSVLPSDTPERRIIIIAVINCIQHGPITGNSGGPYPVEKYAKFFVTEPIEIHSTNNKDIYGEFVGFVAPGTDDAALRDIVQLYR